jgi:hypothetical protein
VSLAVIMWQALALYVAARERELRKRVALVRCEAEERTASR